MGDTIKKAIWDSRMRGLKEGILLLVSDTSVSPEKTLKALEELQELLEPSIGTLKEDLKLIAKQEDDRLADTHL